MEHSNIYGRVELISSAIQNPKPEDIISFHCSREVYEILNSDDGQIMICREIVEKALNDLGIEISEDDWDNLQVRAITMH